jgi:hypothetical protein
MTNDFRSVGQVGWCVGNRDVFFKRVLDQSQEQRESKLTVLCLLIIIILISYIIIYYIIIKLLIMDNHPS